MQTMKRHVLALGALATLVCACSKQTVPQSVVPQPPAPPPIASAVPPKSEATPEPVKKAPPPTPAPVAQQTASPTEILQPRLAPKGIFFLLQHTSVVTDDGVAGLNPGTVVKMISDGGATLHVTDGKEELDVPKNILTNDLDVADAAFQYARAAQATLKQWGTAQVAEANQREAEQGMAVTRNVASRQMDTWDNPLDHRPRGSNVNPLANPLNRGAYNKTHIHNKNPSWLSSNFPQTEPHSPLSPQTSVSQTPMPQPSDTKQPLGTSTDYRENQGFGSTKDDAYNDALAHAPSGNGWRVLRTTYDQNGSGGSWQCFIYSRYDGPLDKMDGN